MTFTSSSRFLYIFDQSGLLCATAFCSANSARTPRPPRPRSCLPWWPCMQELEMADCSQLILFTNSRCETSYLDGRRSTHDVLRFILWCIGQRCGRNLYRKNGRWNRGMHLTFILSFLTFPGDF